MQSNLRDTTDFLNNLPNTVPTDTILASFDIESLYSNIPHELGIQAVRFWLEKYPETLNGRFSNEFILEGIRLILENNTFSFNDKYYKQVKGTAMGTKFAPVYATLTVGYLEQKLYTEIETTFSSEIGTYFIQIWKRFLDDCFLPWTKSVKDLELVHAILNNLHKDLNFTLQYSMVQQPFLDVLVKNNSGKIETDIFYKETDSKQYLSFNSCHPRHTKINIPYNLARRLRTIISEEHVVQTRMQELKSFLIKQKYPLQIIEHGMEAPHVVYVMKCRGCGEEYIGETGNPLRQRVTIHNQQIRDPKTRMLKVSEHIANCAHALNPKYNIFPFYKMYSESTTLRRAKEKLFINTLKPKLNRIN